MLTLLAVSECSVHSRNSILALGLLAATLSCMSRSSSLRKRFIERNLDAVSVFLKIPFYVPASVCVCVTSLISMDSSFFWLCIMYAVWLRCSYKFINTIVQSRSFGMTYSHSDEWIGKNTTKIRYAVALKIHHFPPSVYPLQIDIDEAFSIASFANGNFAWFLHFSPDLTWQWCVGNLLNLYLFVESDL